MKDLDEWRGTNDQSVVLLRRCKTEVRQAAPEAEVILFGSRARGESVRGSDYDLLVLLSQEDACPALKQEIRNRLYDLALEYEVVVSTLILPRRRWDESRWSASPLRERVQQEGVRL